MAGSVVSEATFDWRARRATLRCFHHHGAIPNAPTTMPIANAASTINTIGLRHWLPKKK